jgi:hypothetical protein
MQRVDLTQLRSRKDGRSRIERRAGFLIKAARYVRDVASFDTTEIVLREDALPWIAKGYFLLSEAYKARRKLPGNTQPPKQAAFTALAIMTFRPFEAVQSGSVRAPKSVHANQIFAFYCARRQLESNFRVLTPTLQDRAYHLLSIQTAKCLSHLIADSKLGLHKLTYDLEIDLDLAEIDGLILLFELLAEAEALYSANSRLEERNRLLDERVRTLLGPLP